MSVTVMVAGAEPEVFPTLFGSDAMAVILRPDVGGWSADVEEKDAMLSEDAVVVLAVVAVALELPALLFGCVAPL